MQAADGLGQCGRVFRRDHHSAPSAADTRGCFTRRRDSGDHRAASGHVGQQFGRDNHVHDLRRLIQQQHIGSGKHPRGRVARPQRQELDVGECHAPGVSLQAGFLRPVADKKKPDVGRRAKQGRGLENVLQLLLGAHVAAMETQEARFVQRVSFAKTVCRSVGADRAGVHPVGDHEDF